MRSQVEQDIAGLVKLFLRGKELPLYRERVGGVQVSQGVEAEQVLTETDGDAEDAGAGVANQRDAGGPGGGDYPVFLAQVIAEVGVVVSPFRVAEDGGELGDGRAQFGVKPQSSVGAGFNGGVHPAGNHLGYRAFQHDRLAGFPVEGGADFVVGAAAEDAGQLVAVEVDLFHRIVPFGRKG